MLTTEPEAASREASPSHSRRALLAGALGGVAAWTTAAFGRAGPVRAEGEAILVGGEYTTAQSLTKIRNEVNTTPVLEANSAAGGTALQAVSGLGELFPIDPYPPGTGVRAVGSEIGVYASNGATAKPAMLGRAHAGSTGVFGLSGGSLVPTAKAKTGVYGEANQDANSRGVWGTSSAGKGVEGNTTSGTGVFGTSQSGPGVHGDSFFDVGVAGNSFAADKAAVRGRAAGNSTGVLGFSGVASQPPAPALTGVYGHAAGRGSAGVRGDSTNGLGVRGLATTGTALLGESLSGLALHTIGRLKMTKVSGLASIGAGHSSVTISPGVDVTSDSFVLLTPRVNLGGRALWFTTNATDGKFTIRMSKARSSATPVAWLLLG